MYPWGLGDNTPCWKFYPPHKCVRIVRLAGYENPGYAYDITKIGLFWDTKCGIWSLSPLADTTPWYAILALIDPQSVSQCFINISRGIYNDNGVDESSDYNLQCPHCDFCDIELGE